MTRGNLFFQNDLIVMNNYLGFVWIKNKLNENTSWLYSQLYKLLANFFIENK